MGRHSRPASHRSAAATVAAALACVSAGILTPAATAAPAALPSLLGSAGAPTPQRAELLNQAESLLANPAIPAEVRSKAQAAIAFIRGDNAAGGVPLPTAGAPGIAQFIWPTIAGSCIEGQLTATGTAVAVPGPAELPLPGVPAHATTFIFTALGTGPVAPEQTSQMRVEWINLSTFTTGSTPLTFGGINPEGPATVSGTANTGAGFVVAWLSGAVTTTTANGPSTCNFLPTAAGFEVK